MQIAGYPHYENVCSNILAFFLEPTKEHGLDDLVLKGLVAAAGENPDDIDFERAKVDREVGTEDRKRLDLIVSVNEGEFVIGIENKIGAPLYNDLEAYGRLIDKHRKGQRSRSLKIVLSLRETPTTNDFKSVTYKKLFFEVR
jgi:hypothetical protein